MHFLIADDSQGKIDLLLPLVKRAGFSHVLLAYTTQEAMRMIDRHAIVAAFVDFYIPDENGPAIMRYLKTAQPQARMACTSSSNPRTHAAEALAAGAERFICMSQESDVVTQEIENVLLEWTATHL